MTETYHMEYDLGHGPVTKVFMSRKRAVAFAADLIAGCPSARIEIIRSTRSLSVTEFLHPPPPRDGHDRDG